MGTLVPSAVFQSAQNAFDLAHLNAAQLTQVFGVVLGKWLVAALRSASPRCSVKLLSSYRYVIRDDMGVEMLSLGFLITPHSTPPRDPTGLAAAQPSPAPPPTELDAALQFVEAARYIRDVDTLLSDDAQTREALTNATADLLETAGYDRAAYLQWVADGERDVV